MTEQTNFLLENIRYIMSVGSSSTQTYDIVTQEFIPEVSSINVGSKNISGVVGLINKGKNESKFKDEVKILCVNSIGYNTTLFPPPQKIKNSDKEKGVCKLDRTDIKKITETGEANNMIESMNDRVFVLNRNCGDFLRKYYNTSGELESNKIIKVFSGQWASVKDIAKKLWDDCAYKDNEDNEDKLIKHYNSKKLPTSALNLGDNVSNYAICDIGGGSTTVYIFNQNGKLVGNLKLKDNSFNDIIDNKDKKDKMMQSYYQYVFDECMGKKINKENKDNKDNEAERIINRVIMIQTGKQREAFFTTNETLQGYIEYYMPKGDNNKTVDNVHFMFLPHELEGKYEAIDFCNKIAPNSKLINLELIEFKNAKNEIETKIEISDSIIQTAKQDLNIKGGSRTKKMKNKSKKNSKRKTRKNPIKKLLKKLKKKKTKNKRSKKKKTSKK